MIDFGHHFGREGHESNAIGHVGHIAKSWINLKGFGCVEHYRKEADEGQKSKNGSWSLPATNNR